MKVENSMGSSYAEEIRKYYSEWWENPRDIRNMVFNKLNEYVMVRIPRGKGKKALDIGSGRGTIVSYLIKKGYQVTAVEFNEEFVKELKSKFPDAQVISEDVHNMEFDSKFDIVTCIELLPILGKEAELALLTKLAAVTNLLLVNISNRNSLHFNWVRLRGWGNPFIYNHTPREFEQILEQVGFNVVLRGGIGLVSPISLFKGFRVKLIPVWLAKVVNRLDYYFPKICHLYYVEAVSRNYKEAQDAGPGSKDILPRRR